MCPCSTGHQASPRERVPFDLVRILFLTDNFPPESNAPALRTHEHARRWVAAGHSVTVITCAPNFPNGRVFPGYTNAWMTREAIDGIEVVRVKTFITANEGFLRRSLDYMSFMFSGLLAGVKARKPDVVVATSPQFFAGVAGALLGLIRDTPFVLEVRDLWPASIIAVGAMKRSPAIRALEFVERWMYSRAARIIVTSKAIGREVAARLGHQKEIHVVTNGSDNALLQPRPIDKSLASQLGLQEKFVIGYIGTLGLAHGLDNALRAAHLVQDTVPSARFLFVGSGAERSNLERLQTELKLGNVVMIPQQPRAEVPRYLSLCDLALVHLKADKVFETVIPSKIFEAFAMGIPVLGVGPAGEASELVAKHASGVWLESGNPELLADCITRMYADPVGRTSMRSAALAASRTYDRSRLAMDMLEELKLAASLGRSPA
jgi:colanic acid biosynthesis glycosyl transferase WcaI